MNILDKLKEFFLKLGKKEQTPLLPGTVEKNNNSEEFRKGYSVQAIESPREPSLEECIQEFIKQYSIQEEVDPKNDHKPYNAFIRMFCDQEEDIGKNYKNQIKLMEKLRKKGCKISPQISNDRVVFIHIAREKGIDEKTEHDVEKLYINCDRKNIALLTAAIYSEISGIVGDKLQMKFVSEQCYDYLKKDKDEEGNNYQRNDKIVIYAENHIKAEQIAEKIQELRRTNSQLFSTTKTLPLLPKRFGFIGIGKEKSGTMIKTPLGSTTGITYNDLLAEIMFKSIVLGFDMVLSEEMRETREKKEEDRMSEYVKKFNEKLPEERNAIISHSKNFFLQICIENNINTIHTPTMGKDDQIEQSS